MINFHIHDFTRTCFTEMYWVLPWECSYPNLRSTDCIGQDRDSHHLGTLSTILQHFPHKNISQTLTLLSNVQSGPPLESMLCHPFAHVSLTSLISWTALVKVDILIHDLRKLYLIHALKNLWQSFINPIVRLESACYYEAGLRSD